MKQQPQKVKSLNFTKNLACEAQTYFRSLLLSLRKWLIFGGREATMNLIPGCNAYACVTLDLLCFPSIDLDAVGHQAHK